MSWLDDISVIFKKYDIPDYVWIPIMLCESEGNPNARSSSKRAGEISKGLFQINILANPQYTGLDLYNPTVNAEIAARDFMLTAYKKTKELGLTNPLDITEYVWHFGIRPFWDENHQKAIWRETEKVINGEIALEVPAPPNQKDTKKNNKRIKVSSDKYSNLTFMSKLLKRLQK